MRVSLYLLYTWGATELQFMKFHKPHCKYWLTSQVIWYTCYNEFSKWIILFREHFYNSVLHHSSIPYGIMVQTGEQGYFNAFILYALQRHVEQQWWVGWKSLLMDQPLLMIKPSSLGWRHPVWTEIIVCLLHQQTRCPKNYIVCHIIGKTEEDKTRIRTV